MSSTSEVFGKYAISGSTERTSVHALVDERRSTQRVDARLGMKLLAPGLEEPLCVDATDLSESGLYAHLPQACRLTVGQRCEVIFDGGPGMERLAGESRYATVVRTEPLGDPAERSVGAGLRFDNPLYL